MRKARWRMWSVALCPRALGVGYFSTELIVLMNPFANPAIPHFGMRVRMPERAGWAARLLGATTASQTNLPLVLAFPLAEPAIVHFTLLRANAS